MSHGVSLSTNMSSSCTNGAKKLQLICKMSTREQTAVDDDVTPSSLDILSDEFLVRIFSYLDVADRLRAEAVCRRWQLLSKRSWQDVNFIQITSATTTSVGLCIAETATYAAVSTVDTNVIRQVLSRCGRYVAVLHIIDKEKLFNSYVICLISEFCHNVASCVINSKGTREYSLDILFALNKKLTNVTITSLSDINCLRRLPLESLRELTLGFPDATPEAKDSLNDILSHCSLENLLLNFFNEKTLEVLGEHHEKMERLGLIDDSSKNLTNAEALSNIGKLKNLERIYLCIPCMTDDVIIEIATMCKKLDFVKLEDCKKLTKKGLMSIFSLPKLEEIDFQGLPAVTDDVLEIVPDTVTNISLSGNPDFTDDGVVKLIERMPNLEMLDIKRCTSLAIRLIHGAVDATKKRDNGKVLNLRLYSCRHCDVSEINNSPLLNIITCDLEK